MKMADFMDAEAEESSEEEQKVPQNGKRKKRASKKWEEENERESHPNGKKKRKKTKAMDESEEEEEEEDDEYRLRQELRDLINDDSTESEADESDDAGIIKKRKKSQNSDFDDRLEDDDYDLLEENLGIAVERKKRFKRLRRIEDGESDDEGGREPGDERDAIANQLFDDSGDEHERRSVTSQRPEPETIAEEGSEVDVSDADDFIVDDDGRPIAEKRRKKRPVFDDAALQEAQDIFGIDFDYDEFDKYGAEEADEEDDEDDDYVVDDVDGERARRTKKIPKRKGTKKTIFEIYEPSELKRGHFTDLDNEIRNADVPERMQLRSVPITPVPEGSDELDLEAEWIYKYAFCCPTISIQDAHLSEEAKERARKGPQTVPKIKKALDFMRNQNFEVPFISFYRKEYVNPELNINDLWKVYKYDAKWCELRQRKENLLLLFEKMRSYQLDEIMKNPDAPLPDSVRVIREEDIDRLKSVETSEELNDVHHHFMLYYSHEIPKMQAEVRLTEREAKRTARVEKRRQDIAKAREKGEEIPYQYGMDIEMDEENNDNEEILKQASRTGPYAICRKAGLESFAKKFGLTPEQFAENLRDNYQRHEVEQDPIEPSTVAFDYLCPKFPNSEEVVKAVELMVAVQLAREPLVRKCIREIYMERAKISIVPTKKGIKEIDENHPIYSMKFLKNKPVSELVGDEFLKLSIAEDDKLITMSFSDVVEGAISGNYMDEMKQLYHRDEFSKNVQDWNALRDESVVIAYERMLIPDMKKELRSKLMVESKEFVLRSCCRKMYNWIKDAPYVCNFEDEDDPANEEDDWETEGVEGRKKRARARENDEDWKTNKGLRVMGVAYVLDYSQAAFACIISPEGECTDYLRLPHFLKRKNGPREEDKPLKEADLSAISKFLLMKKPHVIVLGGESRDATWLADEIRECIATLVAEEQFPSIKVEICENELAKIYANGNRGIEEFRDYPVILRQAISLARRIQDPLVEFSRLCSPDEEILCMKYHFYQDQLPKDELLENIYLEFVNRVNEVGVDLNEALQHQNSLNLVQFICGMGPRKAQALIKILKQTNKRIENRTQLVTVCHMGPKVFINCAGFVKIDTASLGDSTETYVEVLDSTRVHPETYEWARKMAIDALEYDDEEETNRAVAVEEIFETPERLKELDLDAFAEELERQGFGNKQVTLYDIRAELNSPYKDLRAPYESPSPEKLFNILTKETPETFYLGKLILATVSSLQRRKPEGEQLDHANPVRNDDSGLWQCPFCLKNDFPELSEVWGHFDSGTCPGKPIGVRLRLDNGISGYIHVRNLSDKHVDNPEDRVRPGQVIHCRVIKIEVDRFSVECTSKSSDLADKNNEWRPQRDVYYDTEAEEKILRAEEEMRQMKQRQAYVKRVIVHSAFHNINYAEAAKMMETMKQGEAIVRPSSKGNDRLTVTWKVTDDVLHHIDVREDEKKFVFSLGKRLFIGNEEYEDLDEILARHVNPMAAYASELLECHYYKSNIDGLEEKADEMAKEQKRENPSRIPCILSASKKYPGKFLLSYLPRERCIHEYISVTPEGVRYRGRTFARVGELFSWFRKHFRDPRPVVTPKTSFYTPGGLGDGIHQEPDDDLNHHTLSMTANETPGLFMPYTPGKGAGARYGSIHSTTNPCTPSSTLYGNQKMFVDSQKTPKYGQTIPGNNQNGFAYPGAPASAVFQQKSRSNHGMDYTDWKRTSGGTMGYENTRGRGRGRGSRGDRGGRGRGRGRGGQNNSYDSSRASSYSNTLNNSNMGDSTPLWDEAESWDEPSQTTQTSSGSDRRNDNSGKSSLWDESENWDDPEPAVPQSKPATARNTSFEASRNAPSNNSGPSSVTSIGGRTPLYDASESWDDEPVSATPRNEGPHGQKSGNQYFRNIQRNNSEPSGQNFNDQSARNIPPTNSGPSSVISIGGRTPLYDASESWDDEPVSATPRNEGPHGQKSGNQYFRNIQRNNSEPSGQNFNDQSARNIPPTNSGPSSVISIGGRTPLYDASESWDDEPVSAAPRNEPPPAQNFGNESVRNLPRNNFGSSGRNSYGQTSRNIIPKNSAPSSGTSIGSRTPLYDASESWDDEPESAAAQNQSLPVQISSSNFPPANSGPPSVPPIASRTPLYAPSESWDEEEPATSRNKAESERNSTSQTFQNVPRNGSGPPSVPPNAKGTPVYAPVGGWSKPDRGVSRNGAPSGRNSYGGMSRNIPRSRADQLSVAPIGSRTPLYDASESWDDEPDPATPQNQSLPAQNSSTSFPPTDSGPPSAPPLASRTPLYAPSESWDEEEPATSRNEEGSERNSGSQFSQNIPRNDSGPPSVPPNAKRTPVYAPVGGWSKPERAVSRNDQTFRNIPRICADPRSVVPIGSRTPLYDASESWDDDPQPAAPENSSRTIPQTNSDPPKVPSIASRTPLYAPSESWDDPESAAPQKPSLTMQNSPRNIPQTNSGPSSAPPIGSRTPLYASNESWDEPEPAIPQNTTLTAQNTSRESLGKNPRLSSLSSSAPPTASRTPLYAPSESWDEPEPAVPRNEGSLGRNSSSQSFGKNSGLTSTQSTVPPIASRTPLYVPSENWDEPESAVPAQNTSRQSFGRIPRINSSSPSEPPNRNRGPVYAPIRHWDDPESAPPRNEGRPGRKFSGQSFRKDQRNNSGSSRARPIGNRAPRKSWNESELAAPRYDGRSGRNFSGQSFRKDQRSNSGPSSSARLSGNRTPLYAPNESWDDPKTAAPSNAASSREKTSGQYSHSTNSGTASIPINVNRSPLYDPSESWD